MQIKQFLSFWSILQACIFYHYYKGSKPDGEARTGDEDVEEDSAEQVTNNTIFFALLKHSSFSCFLLKRGETLAIKTNIFFILNHNLCVGIKIDLKARPFQK
jgi:hypothetical protein